MHGPPTATLTAPGPALDASLAGQLADVVGGLERESSHQLVLDRTTAAALELVPGAEEAGICLRQARLRVSPAAGAGQLVAGLDALQAETGEGPCWEAALHGVSTRVDDLAAEEARWPRLAPRAAAEGVASVLCVQLRVGSGSIGALKVVAAAPGAFSSRSEQVGVLLAAHTARAILDARTAEDLRRGLAHRDVIGQAKGILMERHRITADEAFAMLARSSQHTNRKLHDVAFDLAATGELPGP
ncbi:GAF and ANTAR domain-containing protein [Quadrisphaera sp. KR29]|uniref:GAF and ANTAR domain-containing protein n=1 Tax=Quadrisphaera sp. KR29 TaxID=3461391 RepID=UPI004043EFBD